MTIFAQRLVEAWSRRRCCRRRRTRANASASAHSSSVGVIRIIHSNSSRGRSKSRMTLLGFVEVWKSFSTLPSGWCSPFVAVTCSNVVHNCHNAGAMSLEASIQRLLSSPECLASLGQRVGSVAHE